MLPFCPRLCRVRLKPITRNASRAVIPAVGIYFRPELAGYYSCGWDCAALASAAKGYKLFFMCGRLTWRKIYKCFRLATPDDDPTLVERIDGDDPMPTDDAEALVAWGKRNIQGE
jgi:hypothetical protein